MAAIHRFDECPPVCDVAAVAIGEARGRSQLCREIDWGVGRSLPAELAARPYQMIVIQDAHAGLRLLRPGRLSIALASDIGHR